MEHKWKWWNLCLSSDRTVDYSGNCLDNRYYWTEFRSKLTKYAGLGHRRGQIKGSIVLLALYLRDLNSSLTLLRTGSLLI